MKQLDFFIDDKADNALSFLDLCKCHIFFGEGGKRRKDLNDMSTFISSVPKDKYTIYKTGGVHPLPMYSERNDFPYIINNYTGKLILPNFSRAVYPAYTINNGIEGKRVYAHRLFAMGFVKNDLPYDNFNVDHINEDKLDYSVNNLRWLSVSENMKNIKNRAKDQKAKYKVYGSSFV